jgi:hypothetical protein
MNNRVMNEAERGKRRMCSLVLPYRAFQASLLALFTALLVACGGPEITLTGQVTNAYTDEPVRDATVRVGNNQLETDPTGNFQISRWNIRDTLEVQAVGYEPISIDLESQEHLAQATPPAVTIDTIKLRPNVLSGVVTDSYSEQPLAGALLQVSEAISATTDVEGRYMLNDLPENFTVTITAPDYATYSESVSGTTAFDVALRPSILSGVVKDQYTGEPLAGATVKVGAATATTADDGSYQLEDVAEGASITISAEGYAEIAQEVGPTAVFDAELRPDVLRGALVDSVSKEPVRDATIIATETRDGSDVAFQRIDNSTDGEFVLEDIPEKGYIQVLAPGYRKAVVELASGKVPTSIELEPLTVKSIYVTSAVASVPGLLEEYFDLIDRTELNAIVIDLKSDLRDDLGLIYYDSQVPIVKELETARPIMDIEAILAEAKRRNIYTIARVHIFSHDNVLADAKPEWAAQDRFTGEVFADYPTSTIRYAWLDPWNRNVWDYNIKLSVEAAKLGFDEINFDYIRFPSLEFSPEDKKRIKLSRPEEEDTPEARFANIAAVLEQAQRAINGAGAFLSVDVFGYTTWRPDGLIGQDIELMAEHTDYICPMIYPSHYLPGELGFDNPSAHPYEMILDSMQKGQKQVEDKRAQLRPWLQDFTLIWVPEHMIVEYGPAEVRAQIDAVYDFNPTTGWILYDSANNYTEEALEPAEE